MSASVDFLILGHPRSGTGYMARLFTTFGYAVGHEKVDRHGVSSWMFAVRADQVPYTFDGKTRSDICPRFVFQVVRNPLDVIASMAHTVQEDAAWEFIERYALVDRRAPPLTRSAHSVIAWNRLIHGHDPRPLVVNVERAAGAVYDFLTEHGYQPAPLDKVQLPPTDYNARPHPRVNSDELKRQLPQDLIAELESHSHQYGYEL